MAGRAPRPRTAWNALPLETHLRNGSYRADRHGPIPLSSPDLSEPPWEPDADDLQGLGPAGQRFLTRMLAENSVSYVSGMLLLQAARTLDDLAAWRLKSQTDPAAARLALACAKTFAELLAQMRRW